MEKNVGVANVPGIFPRLREKEILRYVYKKQEQNTCENLKQFFLLHISRWRGTVTAVLNFWILFILFWSE